MSTHYNTKAIKNMLDEMFDIKRLLSEGTVRFIYEKNNGEVREAWGTRNIDLLLNDKDSGFTENDKPKGTGKEYDTSCPYWDLDKKAWRSVRIDSVITILEFDNIEYGE